MSFIAMKPIYIDPQTRKQSTKSAKGSILLAPLGAVVTDADIEAYGITVPGEEKPRKQTPETT